MIAFTSSAGANDTFTYNGLGLRVAKTDSTGTYHYLCDGASPGSSVLWDGFAVYTAGLSEHRGTTSRYYDYDRLGNLWTVDSATGKGQAYYQDTTGFGTLTASTGSTGTPFKFGGENGCLTDADTGLVLMGYRYYDSRTGRFITQDPAGDGDNWYAYADNNPINAVDPDGLLPTSIDGIDLGLAHGVQAPGSFYDQTRNFYVVGVYRIWYDAKGNRDSSRTPEFLYNIAFPAQGVNGGTVSLSVNLYRAQKYGLARLKEWGSGKATFNMYESQIAVYYTSHVAHGTAGDMKNGVKNPLLYQWADDAGNFNAGGTAAALGMNRFATAKSGDVAYLISAFPNYGGRFHDDAHGQQVLQDGFTYYETGYQH